MTTPQHDYAERIAAAMILTVLRLDDPVHAPDHQITIGEWEIEAWCTATSVSVRFERWSRAWVVHRIIDREELSVALAKEALADVLAKKIIWKVRPHFLADKYDGDAC